MRTIEERKYSKTDLFAELNNCIKDKQYWKLHILEPLFLQETINSADIENLSIMMMNAYYDELTNGSKDDQIEYLDHFYQTILQMR